MKNFLRQKSSGQALLIILLISAVALTIGLSITSRSVTDIRISQKTEEAARAYSAAEAGIEEALVTGVGGEDSWTDLGAALAKYTATVSNLGDSADFSFPQPVGANEVQTFWFSETDYQKVYDRLALQVVWGNPGASPPEPALEVIIYYREVVAPNTYYRAGRFALDPNDGRASSNSFCSPARLGQSYCTNVSSFITDGSVIVGDRTYQYSTTLNVSGFTGASKTMLFARLRMMYAVDNHILGFQASGAGASEFPVQGQKIDSVGESGDSTRKVVVVRFNSAPPDIFDFTLFSGSGLEK